MSDLATSIFETVVKELFKERRYFSATCYILSGIIGVLCYISTIASFSCSSDFVDSIVWKVNLSNNDLVVYLPIIAASAYLLGLIIRYCVLRLINVEDKTRKFFVHLLTVVDMIDLLAAIGSLLFIVSVFLQMYNTGEIFSSAIAKVNYLWIAFNFVTLIYVRYANKNAKIIDNAIKKYPDPK